LKHDAKLDSRKQTEDVEKKEMLVRLNFMNGINNYMDEYQGWR
jgi:hypothetical protein